MAKATITVKLADLEVFQRLVSFADEYAWHLRGCAVIDADGDWVKGNPACDCGYDEDLATLAEDLATLAAAPEGATNRKRDDLDAEGWPKRWSDPTYLGDGPWGA